MGQIRESSDRKSQRYVCPILKNTDKNEKLRERKVSNSLQEFILARFSSVLFSSIQFCSVWFRAGMQTRVRRRMHQEESHMWLRVGRTRASKAGQLLWDSVRQRRPQGGFGPPTWLLT